MTQLPLFQDDKPPKSIIVVPTDQLKLSRFNPRSTRPDEDIDRLAQRIARNGFEITRALWAVRNGNGYEVFAGGTRLEAAKRAGCNEIPIVLHEGLTDEDIVRLAYEDNDNDEYHAPVSIVDVWANYAALQVQGWTQEKIGQVMGISQKMAGIRINLHKLPDTIKKFSSQGLLSEGHLTEITSLEVDYYFSEWLDAAQAWLELAQEAKKLTTKETRALVAKWKEFIQLAADLHSKLAPEWQQDFITHLTESKARTKAAVQSAYNATVKAQLEDARRKEEELARQQSKVEAERIRLQQEQERNEQVQAILDCVIHGDFTEVAKTLEPNSIDIIITDPPYPQEYLPLYEQLATVAAQLLKPGGSLLAMCGQSYLPQVLNLMTPHLNYHWALSYLTPGGQSPQIWPRKINSFWKPVLWFVKGEYSDDWHGDVIKSAVNDNDKRFHEWGQSESGMAQLIENFTKEGDLILDPFFGGGTTGVVAIKLNRQFIGIDKDEASVKTSKERLFSLLQEKLNG